jgi:hypothetical protein
MTGDDAVRNPTAQAGDTRSLSNVQTGARRGVRLGTFKSCRAASAATRGLPVVTKRCPEEAHQLARDRDDDFGRHLSARDKSLVTTGEPALCFVGDRDDPTGLPVLSRAELRSNARPMPILPGGLDERTANVSVASFCDAPALRGFTARIEAGNETQVRSERTRRLEALDAVEFRDEDHRDRRIDVTVL